MEILNGSGVSVGRNNKSSLLSTLKLFYVQAEGKKFLSTMTV